MTAIASPPKLALPDRQAEAWRLIREFWERTGRGPTAAELADQFTPPIRPQSAQRHIDKLRLAGYVSGGSYSRPVTFADLAPAGKPISVNRPDAECQALLLEADEILGIVAVADRPRRDEWRRKAADYLRRRHGQQAQG
jgi:SOS-response transcriptional repressor LexA